MPYRIEHDSLGEIKVPKEAYYGAQTERSRRNFVFEGERMPAEIVHAFGIVKEAAARANAALLPEKMTPRKREYLTAAAREVASGALDAHFPLVVFQTGSGTQTNMNVNEVIAHRANEQAGETLLHPNDDVNLSQSSNDTFPAAMHIAAVLAVQKRLLPSLRALIDAFGTLETRYADVLKCGRTHLQDAVPMTFGQEIGGWRASLAEDEKMLSNIDRLRALALGATAIGTGLNAPRGFGKRVAEEIGALTGETFTAADNGFHALSSEDEFVVAHAARKALAVDLMKIANDVRWLSSGPRTGLGEIRIPANEPGSSIMPGKVNPTQCESISMVAVQVMANDTAIGIAASQGNFELNVYLPLIADNFLRSVRLLSDAMENFRARCVEGIEPDEARMRENVERSLMLVTALSPTMGYEKAAKAAKYAAENDLSLRAACAELGLLSGEEFDSLVDPRKMAKGEDG